MSKLTSMIARVTPAIAKSWIAADAFELQRSLKGGHINSIASAMKEGEFPAGTQICFAVTLQGRVLVDGQHRLRAQILSEATIDYDILEVECADDGEIQTLYTQLDVGAKRTMSDRMRALNIAGHLALPVRQAQILGLGAPYLKFHFARFTALQANQMTPLQRLEILRPHAEASSRYFATMATAEPWIAKVFLRPHLVAFGTYTFQHAPERAQALWAALATNDTGGVDDPRHHLFALAMSVNQRTIALKRTLGNLQAFIKGWNAWIEGRPLKQRPSTASSLADVVRILGVSDPQPQPARRLTSTIKPKQTAHRPQDLFSPGTLNERGR